MAGPLHCPLILFQIQLGWKCCNINTQLSSVVTFKSLLKVSTIDIAQLCFLRYSSIVPIIDFRNNYEKGYVDQFYGEKWENLFGLCKLFSGKPDQFRLLYKKDFVTDGTAKKNIRLKWIAICLVMDYVNGEVLIVLAKKLGIVHEFNLPGWTLYKRSKISAEEQEANWKTRGSRRVRNLLWEKKHLLLDLVVVTQETYGCATWPQLLRQDTLDWKDSWHKHLGQVTITVLIFVSLTSFLRLLSPEEGIEYTNCLSYVPTPPGAFLCFRSQEKHKKHFYMSLIYLIWIFQEILWTLTQNGT